MLRGVEDEGTNSPETERRAAGETQGHVGGKEKSGPRFFVVCMFYIIKIILFGLESGFWAGPTFSVVFFLFGNIRIS